MKVDLGGPAGGIFLDALEREGEARDAFVREACGGDAELESQVRYLLEHHRDDDIVTTPRRPAPDRRAEPEPSSREVEWIQTGELVSRAFGGPRTRAAVSIGIALVVLLAGAWARGAVLDAMDAQTRETLETRLRMEHELLREWIAGLRRDVETVCNDPELRAVAEELARAGTDLNRSLDDRRAALLADERQDRVTRAIDHVLHRPDLEGYALVHRSGVLLATRDERFVGEQISSDGSMSGATRFTPPSNPETWVGARTRVPEGIGDVRAMAWFEVPVLRGEPKENGDAPTLVSLVVGSPAEEFRRVMRIGEEDLDAGSETYVVDGEGFLRCRSRFADDYLAALAEREVEPIWAAGAPSGDPAMRIPNFAVVDPGRPVRELPRGGELPSASRTAIVDDVVRRASSGDANAPNSGVRMDPYRDYRGELVVGAWAWLPEHGFALISEMTEDHAFAARRYVDLILLLVLALLGVILLFGFSTSFAVVRLRKRIESGSKLGPYTLGERVGEGGLGEVYLARHALLRRPTAIKLLKRDQVDAESVARFEREVQLASQLTSPHTVAIYDFGRTLEGTFYCAMEYLDGLTLSQVVRLSGDLDPARVVHVLRGACASLGEAHARGLVHRDVKPMNLMLCKQGVAHDFVKLLDFGLVKDISNEATTRELTKPTRISGTLLYLAPERLRDPSRVDGRTDLYSLGAVAFYLLTAKHHLTGGTDVDLLDRILREPPRRPSACTDQQIPPALDDLVFAMLSKDMDGRPRDTAAVLAALDAIEGLEPWTADRAAAWWRAHRG